MFSTAKTPRRSFLSRLAGVAGFTALAGGFPAAAPPALASKRRNDVEQFDILPACTIVQDYKSLKQSSYDRTGGNADSWPLEAGAIREVFSSDGPGVITHIWFTIAADEKSYPLKRIVLRIYWDGNLKPSVEVPLGDFFGMNLGEYINYQSAYLNSSSKALNCYFPMPFRRSARITITNEGDSPILAFYSNIDYQRVPSLPNGAMYFHAQYRQKTPNISVTGGDHLNLSGEDNYTFVETRGWGHLMGVTLGVVQNSDGWMGEGDEMIFIDDEKKPVINGTGTEDYFNGARGFGISVPFAYLYCGAPLIENPVLTGGRYCMYRWHAVTFTHYMKHTIEHGTANDRADDYYSAAYWYQTEPYTDFPPLPPVAERIARLKAQGTN